jgi:hypothetical protein
VTWKVHVKAVGAAWRTEGRVQRLLAMLSARPMLLSRFAMLPIEF